MQKMLIVIMGMILLVGGVFWWNKRSNPVLSVETGEKKLSVVTTFYPLEDFARRIGGDAVEIRSIVPAGAEPHEYEPAPRDILSVYRADVFLLSGAGLDPWAEKIRPEIESRGIAVVELSEKAELLLRKHEKEEKEGYTSEKENLYDPHFWLDPVIVEEAAKAIRDAFVARDPAHEAVYTRNTDAFLTELIILDREYQGGLSVCRLDTIVTAHESFSYLARRYGFKTIALAGLSPEAEPSPKWLAEIAEIIREKGIRYIFFETLVSPKVAETLADEVGAKTLVFNPVEGLTEGERAAGEDYVSIMRENLHHLQTALECQQ